MFFTIFFRLKSKLFAHGTSPLFNNSRIIKFLARANNIIDNLKIIMDGRRFGRHPRMSRKLEARHILMEKNHRRENEMQIVVAIHLVTRILKHP